MDDDEKERKDFELLSIPCESKFNAALRRMAFFNESSSVAEAPSTDTPNLPLRRAFGQNFIKIEKRGFTQNQQALAKDG
jgi:hypothetical protein